MKQYRTLIVVFLFSLLSCSWVDEKPMIQTVTSIESPKPNATWLSHEHLLVDFVGADSVKQKRWDKDIVIETMKPYLQKLKNYQVEYFVDATPNYLARDVEVLETLSRQTGIKILTNTGLYGARKNKFIPDYAFKKPAEELSQMWVYEFENGIDGTSVKPGFIKISVDAADPLDDMHQKLVKAAALTHFETGLTIASHTGKSVGLWPQLEILVKNGVSPAAFIWVHAQNEKDNSEYLKAAERGCWISLDGMGWGIDKYLPKLKFARENDILHNVLISHDAGWYDPDRKEQKIKPYTNIFEQLIPELKKIGFTTEDFDLLLKKNPVEAYTISKKSMK
ncbi:MAG: phosphotriesterase [Cyclobacteriaceae bacterium]